MEQLINITGFKSSNAKEGDNWFEWYWNPYHKAWMIDEPESLCFSTEDMIKNRGGYRRHEPIYQLVNKPVTTTNEQPIFTKEEKSEIMGSIEQCEVEYPNRDINYSVLKDKINRLIV